MEIVIGKTSGFCYGVKRAVEGCIEQIENNKKIYCLGEVVHNKQVIEELEEKGIKFIENVKEIQDEKAQVIVRAHGIDKDTYDIIKSKNIGLIDYTCPNVARIHKLADSYKEQGYYIFLTGIQNHPEIIGTRSYCGENFSLISTKEDIKKAIKSFEKTNIKKLLLISQTTYSIKKFEEIQKEISERISKDIQYIVKNTICLATEIRQKETNELSSNVDKMVIIGGKNSSNIKKLYEIASENCNDTICIETKSELEKSEFMNIEKVGIIAGASTPQKSIDEVKNTLYNWIIENN